MEIKITFTLVLIFVIGAIAGCTLFCGCTTFFKNGVPIDWGMVKETFMQRTRLGSSAPFDEKYDDGLPNNGWETSAMKYADDHLNHLNEGQYHTAGKLPLPPGKLLIFSENKIDPKCCPSYYSSSGGCVCISQNQLNYLNERGGNRTINSEY